VIYVVVGLFDPENGGLGKKNSSFYQLF